MSPWARLLVTGETVAQTALARKEILHTSPHRADEWLRCSANVWLAYLALRQRRRYRRPPSWEAQADQYPLYRPGTLNRCNNPHAATALETLQNINCEHPVHELSP